MQTDSAKRGRSLEDAVEFIHDSILRSDPKYRGLNYRIDTRVIRKVGNRSYEIDVWVETMPETDFRSAWIFECKNWKEPVGQKEIDYLAAKVEALGASKGFLVAKSLTKGAEEIISLDQRLQYIPYTEDFLSPLNTAEMFHVSQDMVSQLVTIQWEKLVVEINDTELDYKTTKCKWDGQTIDFASFVQPLIDKIAIRDRDTNFARMFKEGTHWRETSEVIGFKPDQLLIKDSEVIFLQFRLAYFVTFTRKRIISRFQLEGRGRVFTFEPIKNQVTGEDMEVQIFQRI